MHADEIMVVAKKALAVLDADFTEFELSTLKELGVYAEVLHFWDLFVEEYLIECIVPELQIYKVTNRGRYILSMSDFDESVTVTDKQKKTLIIMSLMGGLLSSATTSFHHNMFDFEDLIAKKFVMTDRCKNNFCPFSFWLSAKGKRFVKNHCIIL